MYMRIDELYKLDDKLELDLRKKKLRLSFFK